MTPLVYRLLQQLWLMVVVWAGRLEMAGPEQIRNIQIGLEQMIRVQSSAREVIFRV